MKLAGALLRPVRTWNTASAVRYPKDFDFNRLDYILAPEGLSLSDVRPRSPSGTSNTRRPE